MEIEFTNGFDKGEKTASKKIEIKGNCKITNYPKGDSPSGAGDLTVEIKDNELTVQKGTVFDKNAQEKRQVNLNSAKYSVFMKLAAASKYDSAKELTVEDLEAAKQDIGKFKNFGVQNIRFDKEHGVATIEMNNDEVLRIDFETKSECGVESQNASSKQTSITETQHKVKAGECLSKIAKQYGVSVEDIMKWNNLKENAIIRPGDTLIIKQPSSAGGAQNSEEEKTTESKTYTVQNGDTLSGIVKKLKKQNINVTVKQLKEWNHLSNDNIREGQVLNIQKPSGISSEQKASKKDTVGFLNDLGGQETKGKKNPYSVKNKWGYAGRYQMGEQAMIQMGIYKKKPDWIDEKGKEHYNNDWSGVFVANNKYGITSLSDYLHSPKKQEALQIDYKKDDWRCIRHYKLDKYIGQMVNHQKITASGLLAGAHLVGVGGLMEYLNGNYEKADGSGTKVSKYIEQFAGYDVSLITG